MDRHGLSTVINVIIFDMGVSILIPFQRYNVALIVEILQWQSQCRDREVAPTEDSFQ